jgi:hypothetical protein
MTGSPLLYFAVMVANHSSPTLEQREKIVSSRTVFIAAPVAAQNL